ncbi:hypothetical protein [Bradyrhizobium sp. dw_78]|uniref:hypothetical protein n=1 Tax=Bradyrhizobium sp. dw_78 TaxID=2719793 RepID=UPI001BD1FFF1|nr:hypothetical protein [Bradyrhizobium sp. dw_78]
MPYQNDNAIALQIQQPNLDPSEPIKAMAYANQANAQTALTNQQVQRQAAILKALQGGGQSGNGGDVASQLAMVDPETANKMRDYQSKTADLVGRGANMYLANPKPETWSNVISSLSGLISPAQVQQLQMMNPDQRMAAARAYSGYGQSSQSFADTPSQKAPYETVTGPNGEVYNKAAALGVSSPAGSPDGQAAPRGLRNNNPLNIEAGPYAQGQPGFAGSDGRFAQFQTPAQGIAAADNLLSGYGAKGINTISGVVNRWAPARDSNNPAAYAAFVSKATGIGPDDKIDLSDPTTRASIIGAMGRYENGAYQAPVGNQGPGVAAPQPGGAQAVPGSPQPLIPGITPLDRARQTNEAASDQEFKNAAYDKYEGAQNNLYSLKQMLDQARDLKSGPLAMGSTNEFRTEWAKRFNSVIAAAGLDPQKYGAVDPDKIASVEDLNKLATRAAFTLGKDADPRGAAVVAQMALRGVPNPANTPQGFNTVLSGLWQGVARDRDRAVAIHNSAGPPRAAAMAFDQSHPVSLYADRAKLGAYIGPEAIDYLAAHPDTAQQFDATYGPIAGKIPGFANGGSLSSRLLPQGR